LRSGGWLPGVCGGEGGDQGDVVFFIPEGSPLDHFGASRTAELRLLARSIAEAKSGPTWAV
jgi:hypothetical protein